MPTTVQDIRRWLNEAQDVGATHMIVATDTFDWTDYPIFVKPGENPSEVASEKRGEFTKITECYALHLDLDAQLAERRAFHYEMPS